jgi:hypothetical protein
MPMLQYLQQQGAEFAVLTMTDAASEGHLAACQFLRAHGCDWDEDTCSVAAANRLDTLIWLHEQGCPWDAFEVCSDAAREGYAGIVHYVYEQEGAAVFTAVEHTELLNIAGHAGNLVVAVFLREQGAEWPAQLR